MRLCQDPTNGNDGYLCQAGTFCGNPKDFNFPVTREYNDEVI